MKIEYLDKLGFKEEKLDINNLKISLGRVEFYKKFDNDFDQSCRIITPDLRYYWDEERFGLHVSNVAQKINITDLFEGLSNFQKNLEILYLSNIDSKNLEFSSISFPVLKRVYISNCLNIRELIFLPTKSSVIYSKGISNNTKKIESLEFDILGNVLEELSLFNCKNLLKLELLGNFVKIKKIEVINCALLKFKLPKECHNLSYLNLSSNKISLDIHLTETKILEYFFIKRNAEIKILWPKKFSKIRHIEIDINEKGNEALTSILGLTDEDLRNTLNAYLLQFHKGKEVPFLRIKLIFIGNTTAGKSTLRRILLSEDGKEQDSTIIEEKSTHGVNAFAKTLKIKNTDVWVQGFDFGGQDYYHATHLPFISHNALNILVFGNCEKDFAQDSAYDFSMKIVEEREEILYPINYWIGSLKRNKILEVDNEIKLGEFLENRNYEGKKYELDGLKVIPNKEKHIIYLEESELEIVQNLRDKGNYQELNNLEIKQTSGVSVGDIITFDFHKESLKVKGWLQSKIFNHATTRPFLYTDKQLMDWLSEEEEVLFTIPQLFKEYPERKNYSTELDLYEAVKRLHSHNFGFYFTPDNGIENFFINRIDVFSQWIHENILSKELYEKWEGYFQLDNLQLDKEIRKNLKRILSFLEVNNVIFKVKNIDIDKWVAPSYLPKVQTKAEELLIESFDKPECIFEFTGFFHSNIILMLIDKFEEELVLDVNHKEYLLWKNKVILHQKSEESKAYLLIELKYPGDSDFMGRFPQLSISRNNSGLVNESNFYKVFDYVINKLKEFGPKISLKTRYNDYIPYECLFQNNTSEGKVRSNLIFHNQTIYSSYDFRHFWHGSVSEPTKIFIGYSKYDIEYVNELVVHLGPYENQGDVVIFYDKDLKMGEKWDEELKHQLKTSDVFVCLVSPNMLNTKYVTELELPLAHECQIPIVPIIISECNWAYLKLNKGGNLLDSNNIYNKAIPLPSSKYERDVHWRKIAEELKNTKPKLNGLNPTNSPASSDEPISGTD